MWINVEPVIDTNSILNQIEKVKELSQELENETYKLRDMVKDAKLSERKEKVINATKEAEEPESPSAEGIEKDLANEYLQMMDRYKNEQTQPRSDIHGEDQQ